MELDSIEAGFFRADGRVNEIFFDLPDHVRGQFRLFRLKAQGRRNEKFSGRRSLAAAVNELNGDLCAAVVNGARHAAADRDHPVRPDPLLVFVRDRISFRNV